MQATASPHIAQGLADSLELQGRCVACGTRTVKTTLQGAEAGALPLAMQADLLQSI